jgi:uncharacterized Zn-finger protein
MTEIICKICGSLYSLTSTHIPVKDSDSIDCEVCGNELYRWNKVSKIYSAKLKEKHENHKK